MDLIPKNSILPCGRNDAEFCCIIGAIAKTLEFRTGKKIVLDHYTARHRVCGFSAIDGHVNWVKRFEKLRSIPDWNTKKEIRFFGEFQKIRKNKDIKESVLEELENMHAISFCVKSEYTEQDGFLFFGGKKKKGYFIAIGYDEKFVFILNKNGVDLKMKRDFFEKETCNHFIFTPFL